MLEWAAPPKPLDARMTLRSLSIAILACAGWAAASDALALGLGRTPESIAFGQPLDLSLPVRLEAGESLSVPCVQAVVHLGAQRLPPGAVAISLEPRGDARELLLRLRSTRVVQEPLVAVDLTLGCGASVSRQFVTLADPLASTPAQPASQPPAATSRAAAVPPSARQAVPVAPRRAEPAPAHPAVDEAERSLKAARLAVAAQDAVLASAARAASAAEAAAQAAESRLAAMATALQATRDEAVAQRGTIEQMRHRLAQGEGTRPSQSLLLLAVAALATLALALAWKLRGLRRERAFAPLPPAPSPAAAEVALREALTEAPVALLTPPTVPAVPPDADAAAPLVPAAPVAADELTRPVSMDELLDLEQQAEFFVVLGEEDAAVDLLMAHLRSSGGSSPLPYLKLLEIFRRRDDADAYERMRKRFGQRFNAVAPDWGADFERGLELQDYPRVLAKLQQAWAQPLDAMAELESLLFRKHGGELFELPAYRDVLMLYAVARDLHRQLDRPGDEVDVLLPLAGNDGAVLSIFDPLDTADDRPTAPVDLDLSEAPDLRDGRSGRHAAVRN